MGESDEEGRRGKIRIERGEREQRDKMNTCLYVCIYPVLCSPAFMSLPSHP